MTAGRSLPASALLVLLLAGVAGCAARSSGPAGEDGQLTVGVSTSGPATGNLKFRLTVQPAGIDTPIDADAGVFTTSRAPAGDLTVSLLDVPARCEVEGGPRRSVTAGPGRYPVIRFVVVCR
jgi:hypothetical protein